MPPLEEAPVYINDVPEVLYDDLWISPDMIIFTGLQQPSESHVLVFKMSPALSPTVSPAPTARPFRSVESSRQ